jgi:hypothetical protein
MNMIVNDSGVPGEPPRSRLAYSLLHNILRLFAAGNCEIVLTMANVGPAVRAARDLLLAFGIEPDMGEP